MREVEVTVNPKMSADIVLLTVNKHEQTQLSAVLEHHLGHELLPIQGASNEVYLDAGEINGQRVMVAKSLIGSTGSGASFDTVTNILQDLSPQVIVAVGIAWGAKNAEGQSIGDILLSTRLRDAQHHKVTAEEVIPRGTIEAANGILLKTFLRAADLTGKRTHEGLLISIETLFDDEQQRDKFIAADRHQAIGGEMEGSGLLMSLRRMRDRRVDWLIVKAICDWGFKKNEDPLKKEQDQIDAARNAAELCVATIDRFRLVQAAAQNDGHSETDSTSQTLCPIRLTSESNSGGVLPAAKGEVQKPRPASHPRLYGREKLLESLSRDFDATGCLLLYGMRGNGKSSVINALLGQEPWTSWDPEIRIMASVVREPSDFFRSIAIALGINDECPQPPTGTLNEQIEALSRRLSRLRRTVVWVDQAHLWFNRDNWRNSQLGVLVAALQRVVGDQWGWIFELRERPPRGLFPRGTSVEVAGLDKESLREWLANSAPNAGNEDWHISGNDLRALYQWLGGGQGHQAHPFATRLLIDVALGLGVSPMAVRQRFLKQAEDQVEQFLLADLFNRVLSASEQKLLLALSLYRGAIPHDHIEPLESRLAVTNAWAGLDQRCLLPADSRQERFYLHGFLSAWLRQKLGYQSEDGSDADVTAHEEVTHLPAKELHQVIGECWLEQVRGRRHVTAVNIERALEAFHHLIAAGELWSVREIAINLIAGHYDGALERLWTLCRGLHKEKKGDDHLERVLRYILQISPDEPKALRFLGETLRRVRGRNDAEALTCFQRAFEVQPSYPPNLANLGVSLLAQGPEGASEYLRVVDLARKQNPTAVNHYVVAVELDCLDLVSPDPAAASRKRLKLINAGSRHAAFYGAEASWQLENGDPAEALRILDLADERKCGDEVTAFIKATALENLGRGTDASRLRQEMIHRGSRNPAIFSAEIAYLIGQNRLNQAKKLLEQAEKRGCRNEYIASARAHVLAEMGEGAEASSYRMKLIDGNSRDAAIYHDEAKWKLEQGSPVEAARLLDRVDEFGIADEYTLSIRASVLEATGRGADASKLRTERINANSRNPAFYTAEAKWLRDEGLPEKALQVLDILDQRGLGNEYANGLRASALCKTGRNEEAARIRQRMIKRGSKYLPVFIAETEWQLAQGDFEGVIGIVGLAKQRGIEDAKLAELQAQVKEFKSRQ